MPVKKNVNRKRVQNKKPQWFSPAKVKQISFSKDAKGKLIKIGEGNYGNVFIGRLKFKDGSVHRVAIKRFKKEHKVDDKLAGAYQRTIRKMKGFGIPIPKMGMVKIKSKNSPRGEWVQVSQLWGSVKQKSKISPHGRIVSVKGKKDTIATLIKLSNEGYLVFLDMIEPFKHVPGVIPIDIDKFVPVNQKEMRIEGMRKGTDVAGSLYGIIHLLGENKAQRDMLLRQALRAANPDLKRSLKKISTRARKEEDLIGS